MTDKALTLVQAKKVVEAAATGEEQDGEAQE
jgi:hypothetical protein